MNAAPLKTTFSDGHFLKGEPAELSFHDDRMTVTTATHGAQEFSVDDVRVSDRLGSIPRFVYLPSGGVIETADNAAIDAALKRLQRGRLTAVLHALEAHSPFAALAALLVVTLAGLSLYFGLPKMARRIAFATPPTIDDQVGRVAMGTLLTQFNASGLDFSQKLRVSRQLERLLPDEKEHSPQLYFGSSNGAFANAFALPGGYILVTDELVSLATDDELAAVLAHELGHLEKRHGLQQVLSESLPLLFVTTVTGDLSTLTSFAGTVPFLILRNGYSRDYEREADQFARDLMVKRGVELSSFPSILKKLQGARPATGPDFSYLSTHPANEERIKLFAEPGAGVSAEPK